MYRPNVRMHDQFKTWINTLFQSTRLDRNQIIRLAIFTAWESETFQKEVKRFKKDSDAPLSPPWEGSESWLWLKQHGQKEEGGRGANGTETQLNGDAGRKTKEGNRILQSTSDRPERPNPRHDGPISDRDREPRNGTGTVTTRQNGVIRIVIQ